MMIITILHNPLSAASRDFLVTLDVTIPEGDDVTVTVGTDTVRIVSGHDACVALWPAFPGYPLALVEVEGIQYQLAFPTSWNELAAWAANPPADATPAATTEMSRTAFLARFEAAELIAARELAKTDVIVDLFWMQLLAADVVDLTYQPVVDGVRYLVGRLPGFDQDRADAILGVTA
ncbi:MAG TPA: hypothetical protein PKC79_02030 [Solidesulfovibrio magneticus]|nr:hypothetical protein [Solidesulfovibrio magneticus]